MTFFQKEPGGSGATVRMTPIKNLRLGIGKIVGAVVLLILLWTTVTSVPTGHVGVLALFGRVTGEVLPEGIHMVSPLKDVNKLSIQTQAMKESASVPSNEGLIMSLDTSLLFRLDAAKAAQVFQTIGRDYVTRVVEPNLRSAIRSVTSSHSANALYTGAREEVAMKIQDELVRLLSPRGIIVESVLLRDVQLPAMLKTSIEAKQQAEQDALRMNFVLQKEKQEAERKRIEAQGISDFQRIVAQGISPQLLEWKGIEATERLATSPNAKVVLIGNSRTGLPLILEPR
jgi:prohibitin 1